MTGELKKRDRLQAFFMSIFFDASVAEFTVRNAAFPDKAGPHGCYLYACALSLSVLWRVLQGRVSKHT
jgi:hypothetical protein